MVKSGFWVGLVGPTGCGSEWVSGQKARRSVDVMSFQKMYGLYGLKYHKIQISGDADEICNRRNHEDKKKTWPLFWMIPGEPNTFCNIIALSDSEKH